MAFTEVDRLSRSDSSGKFVSPALVALYPRLTHYGDTRHFDEAAGPEDPTLFRIAPFERERETFRDF